MKFFQTHHPPPHVQGPAWEDNAVLAFIGALSSVQLRQEKNNFEINISIF